jgi:hypothetical protein
MFGSKRVLFLKNVAYIDLANRVGERRIERFIVPRAVRQQIETFDATGTAIPDAGFQLLAVPLSKGLETHRKRNRRALASMSAAAREKELKRQRDYKIRRKAGKVGKTEALLRDVRESVGALPARKSRDKR